MDGARFQLDFDGDRLDAAAAHGQEAEERVEGQRSQRSPRWQLTRCISEALDLVLNKDIRFTGVRQPFGPMMSDEIFGMMSDEISGGDWFSGVGPRQKLRLLKLLRQSAGICSRSNLPFDPDTQKKAGQTVTMKTSWSSPDHGNFPARSGLAETQVNGDYSSCGTNGHDYGRRNEACNAQYRCQGLPDILADKHAAEVFQVTDVDEVNDWVKRKTEGKIDKIIDQRDGVSIFPRLTSFALFERYLKSLISPGPRAEGRCARIDKQEHGRRGIR